jgi:hypothetical protein
VVLVTNKKLDSLVEYYSPSGQVVPVKERRNEGFHLLLTNLNIPLIDLGNSRLLEIKNVHTMSVGENNPSGIGFVVSQFQGQGSYLPDDGALKSVFWIPPESNLACTLATQGTGDTRLLQLGETSAIYDLPTFIPHKRQVIHGNEVNFTWAEKIFGIKIPSSRGYTAGNRLINLFDRIIQRNHYDCMLMVGERGRAYATFADMRQMPWACTRPEGTNFPNWWIPFETQSEYVKENQKPKIHFVDSFFLEEYRGSNVLLFDDLMASRKTILSLIRLVQRYDMKPGVATVLDLGYVPGRVSLGDVPVFTPFMESTSGVAEYSPQARRLRK